MPRGQITSVVADKGFGFIKPSDGGDDLFFHNSTIDCSFDSLAIGQQVEFEVDAASEKPRAKKVKISGEILRKKPDQGRAGRDSGSRGKFERGRPAGGRGKFDRDSKPRGGPGRGKPNDRRGPRRDPIVVKNGQPGTIASVVAEKGFGFIKPNDGGEDLFFHNSSVDQPLESILPGQEVEFEIDDSSEKPRASKVALRGEILSTSPGRSSRPKNIIANGLPGTVSSIVVEKGFGFISPADGGDELFFHNSVIDRPLEALVSGQEVEFEVDKSAEKARALKVAVCGKILTKESVQSNRPRTVIENGQWGEVASLVIEKGFGFIRPKNGGDDLFFHNSAVDHPFELLVEGQQVEYEIDNSADKPRAAKVAVRGEILKNSTGGRAKIKYPRDKFELGFVTKILWKTRQGFISADTGGPELLFEQSDVVGDKKYNGMEIGEYVEFVRTGEVARTKIDKAPTATAVRAVEKEIKKIPMKELPHNTKSRRKKPTWRR